MLHAIIIILLFVANIVLIRKTAPWKSSVASGFELTLTGCFLSGYWFGLGTGLWVGMVFMLSSYLANVDVGFAMFVTVPASMIVSLAGFLAVGSSSVFAFAMGGVVVFCLVSDLVLLSVMGKEDVLSYVVSDLGHIMVNSVFFRLFF